MLHVHGRSRLDGQKRSTGVSVVKAGHDDLALTRATNLTYTPAVLLMNKTVFTKILVIWGSFA